LSIVACSFEFWAMVMMWVSIIFSNLRSGLRFDRAMGSIASKLWSILHSQIL
jgi:hypothetical protein